MLKHFFCVLLSLYKHTTNFQSCSCFLEIFQRNTEYLNIFRISLKYLTILSIPVFSKSVGITPSVPALDFFPQISDILEVCRIKSIIDC